MSKLYIISLGGSLIAPEWPDPRFIRGFRDLIVRHVRHGHRFILITGGGNVCREYNKALKAVGPASSDDLDRMGIYTTRLNAQLMRLVFGKLAHPVVIEDPNRKVKFKEKILLAGGWKPGRSSDYPAVLFAKMYRAHTVINLSNIAHVYTKDPRKFRDARPIQKMSWPEFRKIVGSKWKPGLNMPFDPIAAQLAQKISQRVVIANGKNLKNLERILSGKTFVGTTIDQ